ncbi:MAG TPA: helix-turn-helix domain-containing protein [Fimbriimonadaceae bacterium]|jgi:AcrR family transcriptional regulator
MGSSKKLDKDEGLRERKKRETLMRIAVAALKLFIQKGYDATTLDEIAAEAGIARRTFFYYFKSKEAILIAYLDNGLVRSVKPNLLAQPTDQTPVSAVHQSLEKFFGAKESKEAILVDKLFASTEAVRARMQSAYIEMEQAAFEALCEMYPKEPRESLRMVAMMSIGATRVAKEAWRKDGGTRPFADYLNETFALLNKAT